MVLGLRPRVVWFVETCGHADEARAGDQRRAYRAIRTLIPKIKSIVIECRQVSIMLARRNWEQDS